QARMKLEEVRRDVTEALGQLRLAAEGQTRHTRRAREVLSLVGPAASALEQALRTVEANMLPAAPPEAPQLPPAPPAREESLPPPESAPPADQPAPALQHTDSQTQQRPTSPPAP
ncbi:MAG TPA: IF-2 protein, partial [Myxococcaceae bacterium]|nr:IF-2 protein [Myxococcaceae bacterium]